MSLPLPAETIPPCKRFMVMFEINVHSYWTDWSVEKWLSQFITERELATARVLDISDIAEERDRR